MDKATKTKSIITGSGSYIPERIVKNEDFLNSKFYDSSGTIIERDPAEIISRFQQITDIKERRHVTDDLVTSDIAYFAALKALESSGVDKEQLDYIIVAHNFGDVKADNKRSEFVPTLAARVKTRLEIKNPYAVAYDLPFGCPGWLQAVVQADYFIRSGDAKRVLVIGAEVLSRISDPHDRDSMLYADGAGAIVMEALATNEELGILAHATRSDTYEYSKMLTMNVSYNKEVDTDHLYLKMDGRKLYEYALKTVPQAVKDTIDKAGVSINDVKKILIHQANGKMDEAILKRIYSLYDIKQPPADVMPMTISLLGNSSVATLPTLYDMIMKEQMTDHSINKGDVIVFASVGAGMNINCVVYRIP
jgi:3-oxoacyl-[acyl-carrier-protein] synthase III